jgi:hypothetical protein
MGRGHEQQTSCASQPRWLRWGFWTGEFFSLEGLPGHALTEDD